MTENKDLTSNTTINDNGEVETFKIHWDHKIPRKGLGMYAVSYTHLTLPTILLV